MNSLSQSTTNINIVPQRLEADHYQTPSFTGTDKTYNQHFDYDLKRWTCDCPNFTKQGNQNCKHIILLRAYIQREKAQQPAPAPAPAAEHHSNSQELISILHRISTLEQFAELAEAGIHGLEDKNHRQQLDLEEHEFQIGVRAEKEQQHRLQIIDLQNKCQAAQTDHEELEHKIDQQAHTINRQQSQLDRQADLISALQTSVCRLNERTISQDETIKRLLEALDQQGNMLQALALQAGMYQRLYEDQAQQIDKLYEQISSQQKPASEQIVRIVVEQPAPAPRQARQPKAEEAAAKEERI